MRGRDVLAEVLRSEGVDRAFGDVTIAEGYARATGRTAVVHLHGLAVAGNAIGALLNARANDVPLVALATEGVPGPALEVRNAGELGAILRRAFNEAARPPGAPVVASVPAAVLDEEGDHPVPPPSTIRCRAVADGVDVLAELLATTAPGRLAVVVGDEVVRSGAVGEVVELVERLGAAVHGAPFSSSGLFPIRHPAWRGMLVSAASAMRATLGAYDRVLLLGSHPLTVLAYTSGRPLPTSTEVLHLASDARELARTHAVRWSAAGDVRATLAQVVSRLPVGTSEHTSDRRDAAIARAESAARARYDARPSDPMAAAHALLAAIGSEVPVVDEAITAGVFLRALHLDVAPDRYFFNRGSGLGWAMPFSVGLSLGLGRRPVLCVVGDGAAMFAPSTLAAAACEAVPVVFVVVDNRQYRILHEHLRDMAGADTRAGRAVATDLDNPPIDHAALARSMGVDAVRVGAVDELGDAVRAALGGGRPHLLHLPVARAR